jgi:elongator complex protein 2
VATASADGSVRIWEEGLVVAPPDDQAAAAPLSKAGAKKKTKKKPTTAMVVEPAVWGCSEVLSWGAGLPVSVALSKLSSAGGDLVLAVGGDDAKIRLYTKVAAAGSKFELSCTLSGHDDWIRALSFATMDAAAGLLLASGSQDSYIRIWKLTPTATKEAVAVGAARPKLSFRERALMETTTVFTVPPLEPGAPLTAWSVELEALLLGHDSWV